MSRFSIFPLACLFFTACSTKTADLLVYNAHIYTVDSSFKEVEAMAIDKGLIVATGKKTDLEAQYSFQEKEDAAGQYIYPGFIDAHAHFVGYAMNLLQVDLVGTKSWDEILQKVKEFAKENPKGWIIGRGWDQNDWAIKNYPVNTELNTLFPDRPVLLTRIDGHAAIANQKALMLAGITGKERIIGGEVESINHKPTGILIDNAVDIVSNKIPEKTEEEFRAAIAKAQENCFAMGLTTLNDCGLDFEVVEKLKRLQEEKFLRMRLYIMLSDKAANYEFAEKNGKLIGDRLTVRSFKVYGDGALGSRGACLLQPYSDRANHYGFLLSNAEHYDSVASWCFKNGWQMNTHAIGDSGNRVILSTYAKYLAPTNDLRWRIEHAQVVNPADIQLFGKHRIIPSVQPTHATSDMYWASDRLGTDRIPHAYAYKTLLEQNKWIPLGTDFPVEDISPFKTFYAAVFRQDGNEWPANGFQMNNSLSREEALRGMTIWAAKANFEETKKGSLEVGKYADFVILDKDLMTVTPKSLREISVIATYSNGKKEYSRQKN
ncbi:MAG: amidohydrolase [Chitinophagaceae bacterium]|nr:amidohydrolase [Chitinophagaceae bacterium]